MKNPYFIQSESYLYRLAEALNFDYFCQEYREICLNFSEATCWQPWYIENMAANGWK
jgi:hypothetical protein